jgi:hypothetical protein
MDKFTVEFKIFEHRDYSDEPVYATSIYALGVSLSRYFDFYRCLLNGKLPIHISDLTKEDASFYRRWLDLRPFTESRPRIDIIVRQQGRNYCQAYLAEIMKFNAKTLTYSLAYSEIYAGSNRRYHEDYRSGGLINA